MEKLTPTLQKLTGIASPLGVGGEAHDIDQVTKEELRHGVWDLNDDDTILEGVGAVVASKVLVSFTKVQKVQRADRLQVPNTNFDPLFELAEAPVAVATSSTLVNSPGASVLSSESEPL